MRGRRVRVRVLGQLHHLLTHTGGTGDIFGLQLDSRRLTLRTLDDLREAVWKTQRGVATW